MRNARDTLKLTREMSGRLIAPPISPMAVYRLEHGATATAALRNLCRAYMREARRLGYDAWEYHESVLCPEEFPAPVKQDDAELDRILGEVASGRCPVDSGGNNQANHHNSLDNTGDGAAPSPADSVVSGQEPVGSEQKGKR